MKGSTIESLLKKDPVTRRCFIHVLAADQLPNKLKVGLYILNTDPIDSPGQHWTVFYKPNRGPVEFFDSFGHPPQYYHRHWKAKIYNRKQLQAPNSTVCGLYCVYFALHR